MTLAPQQFCVRWNSYHTNLQTVFPKLLSTENFVDVTLACENRQIKCHKVVLSACSTYFEKLLIQNPCKHPIIFMKDMRFSEMQSLVDFMYKGEVNVSQDDLPSLLKSAEALQIRGLCGSESSSGEGNGAQDTNNPVLPLKDRESSPQSQTEPSKDNSAKSSNANDTNENSSMSNTPSSPNVSKRRRELGTSPESSTESKNARKNCDTSVKEEMVEEDGLYYGEMDNEDIECGDNGEDDTLQSSNPGSQPPSDVSLQKKRIRYALHDLQNCNDPLVNKLQKCPRLSVKMCSNKLPKNSKIKLNNTENSEMNTVADLILSNDDFDYDLYENEEYLKEWLLKNQELEVSFVGMSQNLKPLKVKDAKASMLSKKYQVKSKCVVDKKMKRSKSAGVEEMAAFLEPSDLDQFLAGKEVSSSGISRKAIEQAMMGKYNPNRRYSNQAMWAALMDVKKGGSIYRAAQTHKVPRKSLRNWMKRWHIKSSFPMPQQLKQFVENNRKHKLELRREFTNTLLSLGSKIITPEELCQIEGAYSSGSIEVEDDRNLEEDCNEVIDMSRKAALENMENNFDSTKKPDVREHVVFSNVEQLAGISQNSENV